MKGARFVAAFVFAACALAGLTYGARSAESAPNILVIVTDDQRSGTLGVMPATNRFFFHGGRAFRPAFVTTPLCCPSRASIFTGLFAHNHGIKTNGTSNLPQERTMQRYLQDGGYRTAVLGKYLQFVVARSRPSPLRSLGTRRGPTVIGTATSMLDGQLTTLPGYVTDVLASRSVRILSAFDRSDDAAPWFMYVATTAPHSPALPEPRYADAAVPPWHPSPAVLESDRSDKPPWVRAQTARLEQVRDFRKRQLQTLMSVDDLVGKIFDADRLAEGTSQDTRDLPVRQRGLLGRAWTPGKGPPISRGPRCAIRLEVAGTR